VAVKQMQEWMRATENPHYPGVFVWGDGAGHRFGREFSTEAERIRRMAEHVLSNRPDGAAHPWWSFKAYRAASAVCEPIARRQCHPMTGPGAQGIMGAMADK